MGRVTGRCVVADSASPWTEMLKSCAEARGEHGCRWTYGDQSTARKVKPMLLSSSAHARSDSSSTKRNPAQMKARSNQIGVNLKRQLVTSNVPEYGIASNMLRECLLSPIPPGERFAWVGGLYIRCVSRRSLLPSPLTIIKLDSSLLISTLLHPSSGSIPLRPS